jgi:hypothetical protein
MKYKCTKGVTLKSGKHYGVGEIISEEDYNKLTDAQKNNFVPNEDDQGEDNDDQGEDENKGAQQ